MEHFDVAVVGMGALGSAAAYHLSRRGARTVAFEQFELGHVRGASHDTSRIIRTSYGSPQYVRLAQTSYRDWADFEAVSGERLTTVTGGLVFIPTDGPFAASDFVSSLGEAGVPHELLSPDQVHQRWPQFSLPPHVETIYTPDSGIVHASRSVAALQMHARVNGAVIRDRTPVLGLTPDDTGVVVRTAHGDVHADKVVLAADAWTNELLGPLGAEIPLITMQEQVTYFAPGDSDAFDRDRFPVWIWEDEQCFYGFPTYGEPTIKAARDRSDNLMSPEERTFVPSPELLAELTSFMSTTIPASGEALRTVTCQYAITPDRNFVIGPVPQHPDIIVALGAGHAFKFTPTIGRILAELALDGRTADDISTFGVASAANPAGGIDHRPVLAH
ncbi:N-methyl-L-tryptophan oxidase [Microbacterium sp. NPDC089189]|uniref:N-methyl-L-tryptophan oxidase n=1 Tax=Microbacterium sp. NPDC089189 TaxID=3154972 RepID=UPI0034224139